MRGSGCYAPMSYYNGSYVPRQAIREGESAGNLLLRTETCLNDELRPGRPRTYEDEKVAAVINRALQERPAEATHWSVRLMAEAEGVSKSTVQRWFSLFGVKPHLRATFKLSTDPFFIEKVRDIVGLYLDPPEHALVLCVDEKSQIQALERSQPILPLGLGYVEGYTHDYVRHGTTTLFPALDVATGDVLTSCKSRHRHQEFLSFLREIDRKVPAQIHVHLVLDNYATQACESEGMVSAATAVPGALHADVRIVAKSGGDLVRNHQPAGDQAGLVSEREGVGATDQGVYRTVQPGSTTVRVDRHGAVDHRQGGPTIYSYLRDGTPVAERSFNACRL